MLFYRQEMLTPTEDLINQPDILSSMVNVRPSACVLPSMVIVLFIWFVIDDLLVLVFGTFRPSVYIYEFACIKTKTDIDSIKYRQTVFVSCCRCSILMTASEDIGKDEIQQYT